MAKTNKDAEIERITELMEPLLLKKEESSICFILGGLITGSCTEEQQTENAKLLQLFLQSLQGLEKKHNTTYSYTEMVAEYLEGWLSRED